MRLPKSFGFSSVILRLLLLADITLSLTFAQTPAVDSSNGIDETSLMKKINSAKNESEKARYYLELSTLFIENDPNKAEEYLNEFYRRVSQAKNDSDFILYHYKKGEIDINRGNFDNGVQHFLTALKAAEKSNDNKWIHKTLNSLAIINIRTKNYDKGIKYFKKLIELAKRDNDVENLNISKLNLALAYAEAGKFEQAENVLLKTFEETDDVFFKAVAANSLSFIYNNSGEYKKALVYAKHAKSYADTATSVLQFRLECLTNYANALRGLGENKKALKITEEIARLAKEKNMQLQHANAVGNLALIYESLGDYKKALSYFKEYSSLHDSLISSQVTQQVNELQIKYETEKKDKELAIKNAELKRKDLITKFSSIIAVILLIFSGIIFAFYRKTKRAYLDLVKKHVNAIKKGQKPDLLPGQTAKTKSLNISEEKTEEIFNELEKLMIKEKQFLRKDLTLGKLAGEMGISAKYLSTVIHAKYGESFPDFINRLRVEEAAKLLIDPQYENLSLEAIGEMAGFNSRSVFNSAFKKFTGVTPSFYFKSAKHVINVREN